MGADQARTLAAAGLVMGEKWIVVGVYLNGDETELPILWETKEKAEEVKVVTRALTPAAMRLEVRQVADGYEPQLIRRK
jgi:hypothetical protein